MWWKKLFFIQLWKPETLLIIVSFMLVADLFFTQAQPQTFDEWSHLLTLNGFYASLSHMSFPVSWIDTVSNYGSPLGEISHQTTSYIAALVFAITHNSVMSYNLTLLMGSIMSTLLLYYFLRLHFSQYASAAGASLFTFAPYRIANIYIRGALPEFFTSAFIPLILIGIHLAFVKKSVKGLFFIFLGSALLALSHPMMLVVGFSLVTFYLLYALWTVKKWQERGKYFLLFCISAGIGVLIASYYLLPLTLEIKYFYHGQIGQSPANYYFLTADDFFREQWRYYNFETVGIRENRLQLGLLELIVIIGGAAAVLYHKLKKRQIPSLLYWWLLATLVYFFLMTPGSDILYRHIFLLSGIQFPWRFLIVLVFIPPVFLAYIIDSVKFKNFLFVLMVVFIIIVRFPQLYGKNYIVFPQSRYAFATINPHGTDMNTIWSGKSDDYPVQTQKVGVVEGTGVLTNLDITPTTRKYTLTATTPVRVVDYTFYFPGWQLFVNTAPMEIEYQDPEYRGVITYRLPPGTYDVQLLYKDTKIRFLGKIVSLVSLILAATILLLYARLSSQNKKEITKKLLD